MFLVNNQTLTGADAETIKQVEIQNDRHRENIFRFGIVISHVDNAHLRIIAWTFHKLLADSDVFLGRVDPRERISEVFQTLNEMNREVSSYLDLLKRRDIEKEF